MMNKVACAELLADITPNGRAILEEHLKDYGEILLHLLASNLVSEPLIELFKHHSDRIEEIEKYCKVIESMWKQGDDAVRNVVDVTILEELSYEVAIWEQFGTFISKEFKHYINSEVLVYNLMMGGVKPL